MHRDFTYIDDIVEGVIRTLDKPAVSVSKNDISKSNLSISNAPYKIFNIGNGNSISLIKYVKTLENVLGIKANINFMDMQKGDVTSTDADNSALNNWVGFKPSTSIDKGIQSFVDWYKEFYHVKS